MSGARGRLPALVELVLRAAVRADVVTVHEVDQVLGQLRWLVALRGARGTGSSSITFASSWARNSGCLLADLPDPVFVHLEQRIQVQARPGVFDPEPQRGSRSRVTSGRLSGHARPGVEVVVADRRGSGELLEAVLGEQGAREQQAAARERVRFAPRVDVAGDQRVHGRAAQEGGDAAREQEREEEHHQQHDAPPSALAPG